MTFRLVDRGWESEFVEGLRRYPGELRIVCPFVKRRALERILPSQLPSLRVITRFNLRDFAEGVSDIESLRSFLDAGGAVRGLHGLHAKLYIFGTGRAIITSANLTGAGLTKNREFGIITEDSVAVERCLAWFDALWQDAGNDLQRSQLDSWTHTLSNHLASGAPPSEAGDLGDFGAVASFEPQPFSSPPPIFADPAQAFIKFLGEGKNRAPLDFPTVEEIDRAGCHWALAYPAGGGRRPTGVQNGAVMFIARLVKGPDIRIFGRAIALKHVAGRDDATPADIERRSWKARWPRYIRVHHAEFVAGTMRNGVSLLEMMDDLRSDSLVSTQRNAASGQGNTNPRRSIMQKAAAELSNEGFEWLSTRLQTAFEVHGQVPRHILRELDRPEFTVPAEASPDFTQDDFDRELLRMLDVERQAGRTSARIVARDLHRHVVGSTEPNRFPMACNAMWKLWRLQGSIRNNIVRTTESGQSSTIEIEFAL